MNKRPTWLLSGLLALILTACAGTSPAPGDIAPAVPSVATITPTATANAEMLPTPTESAPAVPVAVAVTPASPTNAERPPTSTESTPVVPTGAAVTPPVIANAESLWRENREGEVVVELQPLNLAEPEAAPSGRWAFRIKLETTSMDAPPLAEAYNLAQLAYLTGPNGEQVSPISWTVEEEGHMGHHVQGILMFPEVAQSKNIQVVIREVGGVSQRLFEWPVP